MFKKIYNYTMGISDGFKEQGIKATATYGARFKCVGENSLIDD